MQALLKQKTAEAEVQSVLVTQTSGLSYTYGSNEDGKDDDSSVRSSKSEHVLNSKTKTYKCGSTTPIIPMNSSSI